MERPVEVAFFERGELRSVHTLAPGEERRTAFLAGMCGAGLVLLAMLGAAALVNRMHWVVHAPTFFVSWLGVAATVGWSLIHRTSQRARRFSLGADIESDAFAMVDVDLVRRRGDDYELGLVQGMSGILESGRSTMPIEALTGASTVRVLVPREGQARIDFGLCTFVVRRVRETKRAWRGGSLLRGLGRLVQTVGAGVPVAAFATFLASMPAALSVAETDLRRVVPVRQDASVAESLEQAVADRVWLTRE